MRAVRTAARRGGAAGPATATEDDDTDFTPRRTRRRPKSLSTLVVLVTWLRLLRLGRELRAHLCKLDCCFLGRHNFV